MSIMTDLPIPDRGPVAQPDFFIKPENIPLGNISDRVFGDRATAAAAYLLVQWARASGGWRPFTLWEIQQFYKELRISKKKKRVNPGMFYFESLVKPRRRPGRSGRLEIFGGGWIVLIGTKYHFTEAFVRVCHCPRNDQLDKATGQNFKLLARKDVGVGRTANSLPAGRRRPWS